MGASGRVNRIQEGASRRIRRAKRPPDPDADPRLRQPRYYRRFDDPTVPARRQAFVMQLRGIDRKDTGKIWSVCAIEKRNLLQLYGVRYVRRCMTDYRSDVASTLGPRHPALAHLHLAESEQDIVNAIEREAVRARNNNRRALDPEAFVANALQALSSQKYIDVSVGLVALTGRRPHEVYSSGSIEAVAGERRQLLFSGQAKTKDAPTARTTYVIPTLTDSDAIIEAWNYVRRARPDLVNADNAVVNSVVSKRMVVSSEEVFGRGDGYGATGRMTMRDLRSAYAEIAHSLYCPDNVVQARYFSNILGHALNDETSMYSYFKYYLLGEYAEAIIDDARSRTESLVQMLQQLKDADDFLRPLIERRIAEFETTMTASAIARAYERASIPETGTSGDVLATVQALSSGACDTLRAIANNATLSVVQRRPLSRLLADGLISLEPPSKDELEPPTYSLTPLGRDALFLLAAEIEA